jgi:microcystin-dependent protein
LEVLIMSEPFIGEIRLFPYSFVPYGWAACNGASLSIQQFSSLYSIIGATYGDNGATTFNLPDLQGRAPVGFGTAPGGAIDYEIGQPAGAESITLTTAEIPSHNHALTIKVPTSVTSDTDTPVAGSSLITYGTRANSSITTYTGVPAFTTNTPNTHFATTSVAGTSVSHENRQPALVLRFCIAMDGIYPIRT